MRTLLEYPICLTAFKLIGSDNGMPLRNVKGIIIPAKWEQSFAKAEQELCALSIQEVETLCIGEYTEAEKYRNLCPEADRVFTDAFDGDLNEIIYEW